MKNIEAAPIWDDVQASAVVPSNISDPVRIAAFASQLSAREKQQVATAYKAGSYEMATAFVWGRAMAALKRELSLLGITFLGELLGRSDITDDDDVQEALTEKEAIRLAEELGLVPRTDAIRLRHLAIHSGGTDRHKQGLPNNTHTRGEKRDASKPAH